MKNMKEKIKYEGKLHLPRELKTSIAMRQNFKKLQFTFQTINLFDLASTVRICC